MQTCGVTAWAYSGSASATDGLNDQPKNTSKQSPPFTESTSSGTHYSIVTGGSSFQFRVSPSAVTAGQSGASASLAYQATATPVLVSDSGCIEPGSVAECLVGQGQMAEMSVGSYTLSNYQWSFSGGATLFDAAFLGTSGTSHWWYPFTGSTGSTVPFYAATAALPETIQCTATVSAPVTLQTIGQASATFSLNIVSPPWTYTYVAGVTSFLTNQQAYQDVYLDPITYPVEIIAGTVGGGWPYTLNPPGMAFSLEVTTPSDFTYAESTGQDFLVQLVSCDNVQTYTEGNPLSDILPPAGDTYAKVLDTAYPYPFDGGPYTANGSTNSSSDSPNWGMAPPPPNGGNNKWTTYVGEQNSFSMFLAFNPPSWENTLTCPVPLVEAPWTWNSYNTLPSGSWTWPAPTGSPVASTGIVTGYLDYQWDSVG